MRCEGLEFECLVRVWLSVWCEGVRCEGLEFECVTCEGVRCVCEV